MPLIANVHVPTGWDILLTPAEQEARRKAEQEQSKLASMLKKHAEKAQAAFSAIWEGRE